VPLFPDPAHAATAEAHARDYLDKYLSWSTDPGDPDDVATRFAMCEASTRGDRVAVEAMGGAAVVGDACRALDQLRHQCAGIDAAVANPADPELAADTRAALVDDCATMRGIDAMLAGDDNK